MPIPGLKPQYDVRGKVRIGEKQGNRPVSVDHFVSDDPELDELFGKDPKQLRIIFPFTQAGDCFATGLEWWKGKLLACYSKGDGNAARIDGRRMGQSVVSYLDPEDVKTGPKIGPRKDRQPIVCPFRECRHFGSNADNKECRVMGRLQFFLAGGRTDQVLQLDTKAWNSIERLEGALASAVARNPDLRGRVFTLSVAFETKGANRFPVLSLEEEDVNVNTPNDVEKADALVALAGALERGEGVRESLAAALDATRPGWRDNPAFIERIGEVGIEQAARSMVERMVQAK